MRLNCSTITCSNLPRIMETIFTSFVFTCLIFFASESQLVVLAVLLSQKLGKTSSTAGLRDNLLDSSPFAAYSLDLPRNVQAVVGTLLIPKLTNRWTLFFFGLNRGFFV